MNRTQKILSAVLILALAGLACRAKRGAATPAPATPAITTSLAVSTAAAQAPPVPQSYLGLYVSMRQKLDAAEKRWSGAPPYGGTIYAAELLVADDNRGPALFQPETPSAVRLYLDRLQALGVKGVKSAIQYPLFTPDFPDYDRYLEFYRQVGQEIHKRDMLWTIQASILFANSAYSPLRYDYSGLTWEQFKQQDRAMLQTMIKELHPDYLALIGEPDTAARLTGLKQFNDPQKCVELVNFILDGLDRQGVKLGAGTGTWSDPVFVEKLAAETDLDFISLHFYPLDAAFLDNADRMAQAAQKHGKPIIITEAWLYKTDQPGGGSSIAATEDVFRRDAYSFWTPLDTQFLRVMADFSNRYQVGFLSFFWSQFFFGSLEYSPELESLSYGALRQQANALQYQNLRQGIYGPLGEAYRNLIAANAP